MADRRKLANLRRGVALYVSVLATATIVSVLALSAVAVVRLERKQAETINARLAARSNARSAAELALRVLNNNSSWRSTYANNTETTPVALGANAAGTLSWKLLDVDGDLTNADAKLWLKGIGRVGEIVQVSSLQIQADEIGPYVMRSYNPLLVSWSNDEVKDNKWWAQYFKASLPSGANGWRITSVEVWGQKLNGGNTIIARLYRNSLDPANVVESVTLSSSGFPSTYAPYAIAFNGSVSFNPNDAVYFALETPVNSNVIKIQYRSGASESNSALVQGSPAWGAHQTDKALRYRVNGYYTVSNSGVAPVAGTWTWDSP